MTPGQIVRARALREDAGSPRDRWHVDQSLASRLEGELIILEQQKAGTAAEYQDARSNWRTEERNPSGVPYAITEDVAIGRSYWIGGVVALGGEMLLAAWLFASRGINPWVGALFALAITLIFERAIHFAVFGSTGHRRPKRAIRRLRNFAFYPALVCFLFAVAMSIVARTVEGSLAASDTVVIMVMAGWGFLTLGLVFLASSLFAAAFIYRWSARLADRFAILDRDQRASTAFLAEIRREMPQAPDGTRAGTALALLLAAATAGWSCTAQASGEGSAAAHRAGQTAQDIAAPLADTGADCHVVIDASGSLVVPIESWRHVKSEMVEFVEASVCRQVAVWTFDSDGWTWTTVVRVEVPLAPATQITGLPPEVAAWSNFREAALRRQRDELAQQRTVFRQRVVQALGPLESVERVLRLRPVSRTSDPVGALRRIACTPGPRRQIFVLITDMADTAHGTSLPPIPAPSAGVKVLLLLVPAKPSDALIVGAPASASEQFERTRRALAQAVPWAAAAPYFAADLAVLISGAGR